MASTQSSTTSADGTTICYETHGEGPLALVFVHGWCCNHTHWQHQIAHFAKDYQVVTLDLGGHGTSGQGRAQWTMREFVQKMAH